MKLDLTPAQSVLLRDLIETAIGDTRYYMDEDFKHHDALGLTADLASAYEREEILHVLDTLKQLLQEESADEAAN